MAKILLTGAAGFIGINLYKKMSHAHDILALDSFSDFSNYQIKLDRLINLTHEAIEWDQEQKLKSSTYSFYHTDIADIHSLEKVFASHRFDAVIHLAAMTGVRQSISNPAIYEQSNVVGFTNLLEMCRIHGIKKIIYASSSSVYGNSHQIPFREDASIDNLLNYYAVTKRMNELAAENYSNLYDIKMTGLRFFTVYGPWTRPDMATYSFIRSILSNKPITLYNNGEMKRDFTYIDDIVESIERILEKMLHSSENLPAHAIYNIGGENPVNVKEYVRIIQDKLGIEASIINAPRNKEEMAITFADCSKLASFIGFKPIVAVEEGLEWTIEWFLDYRKNFGDKSGY